MSNKSFIGVDIGGTKMHFACVTNGLVQKEFRCPTDAMRSQDEIIADIVNGIRQVQVAEVDGIGIGVPGLVDVVNGVVYNVQNIPAWRNVELAKKLKAVFDIPVFLGNDANCFALGEKFFGKGQPYSNLVCIALGTGVGGGVIINDSLILGNCSIAGEFGGIKYLDSDFENYCSGKFFKNTYCIEGGVLAQMASEKDPAALEAFDAFGVHVARLIETIILSHGPDAIIIGGSLSKSYSYYKESMTQELMKFPHQHVLEATVIEVNNSSLIPVLGAAALVPYNVKTKN